MKKEYFQWDSIVEKWGITFPVKAMQEVFLLDPCGDSIWLSEKAAEILFHGEEEAMEISRKKFEEYLSESSVITFQQELQRILSGKEQRVSCHAAIVNHTGSLSSVI